MKEKIRKLLLFVCACVFVYSVYQLGSIYFEYKEIEKDTENLIVDYVENPTDNTQNEEGSQKEEPKNEEVEKKDDPLKHVVKFSELLQVNKDIVGWIYIPDTNINYPVMQNRNQPEYYLRRNFYKKYSPRLREGILF